MNKEAASRKPRRRRRSYDNTLRAEQAHATRERILDAAVAVLTDPAQRAATMADVARHAGVSEPTLYRHFGNREHLIAELERYAHDKLGARSFVEQLDELPAQIRAVYSTFRDKTPLLRAVTQTGVGREIRDHGSRRRFDKLREILAEECGHLPPEQIQALTALFRVMAGYEAFHRLTDELGVDPDDAADVTSWALTALIERIRQDQREGRTSLGVGSPADDDREGRKGGKR